MSDKFVSTVIFTSNLQPVQTNDIRDDYNFISKIIDPIALFEIAKNPLYKYRLSRLQEKIFRASSCPCAYAEPGDYSFGTIIDENGIEKNVCKCEKRSCPNFSDCRPDLSQGLN